jgi:lipopolysaccharide transport system permease protein
VLAAMMAHYGVVRDRTCSLTSRAASLILALSLGAGLWLSALNVEYRDIRYGRSAGPPAPLVPFARGLSHSLIPAQWSDLYNLNPMVGLIEGFRWALLAAGPLPARSLFDFASS